MNMAPGASNRNKSNCPKYCTHYGNKNIYYVVLRSYLRDVLKNKQCKLSIMMAGLQTFDMQ